MISSRLHLAIADDHAVVRLGYRRLLEGEPDLEVVAEYADADQAWADLALRRPGEVDLLILDLSMPGRSGLDLLRQLAESCRWLKVLVFTMHDTPALRQQCLRAGAAGFLGKSSDPEALAEAVRRIARGLPPPGQPERPAPCGLPHEQLTPREHEMLLLMLSGLIGFSIGDGFLFTAFQQIGAKRTLLIFSANPLVAALFSRIFLGEALALQHIAGILLAVIGIMIVIQGDVPGQSSRLQWQGILWAVLATLGQAGGVILSKLAMADLEAVPAAQIRLVGGTLGMGIILTLLKKWGHVRPILSQKNGSQTIAVSVVLGTLVGMVLSMLSIKLIPVAIASILFSLMPVMILPISAFFLKERVNPREILGALITVGGVSLLFI